MSKKYNIEVTTIEPCHDGIVEGGGVLRDCEIYAVGLSNSALGLANDIIMVLPVHNFDFMPNDQKRCFMTIYDKQVPIIAFELQQHQGFKKINRSEDKYELTLFFSETTCLSDFKI